MPVLSNLYERKSGSGVRMILALIALAAVGAVIAVLLMH